MGMKYLDTKKGSLEEAVSKAMNGDNKPSADTLVAEGGKYLKYSDLLLQKGRLMAKNQSTAMIDKEIKKEMGKLGIKEKLDPVGKADGDIDNDGDKDSSDKYLAKRRKAISKAIAKDNKKETNLEEAPKMKNYKNEPAFFTNDKKDTLQKLMKDRRDGYGETDLANYLAQKTGKDPEDVYFDDDELVYGSKTIMRGAHKQTIDKLLAKLKTIRSQVEETNLEEGRMKELHGYIAKGMSAKDIAKKMNVDVKTIETLMKEQAKNDIKEYIQSDGSRRKVKEGDKRRTENKLNEKDLDKNVEETLDLARQANVEKGRSMRNILADIWKMNEGKSPFEKDEEKDKKKKEEVEKEGKTATGKKATKIEIEPEIK